MRRYAINESTLQSIANEIRAKTGETGLIEPENMAAGVARAREAGYKSAYDPDKVIEKTVSGGGLVFLDDVSEVRHSVRVKLSSDTITEFMNTYVRAMGKNLFDLSAFNDSATCGGVSIKYDRITQVFTLHGTCTGAATVFLPLAHSFRAPTCRLYIERVGGIASGGGLQIGISPDYSMPTTPIVEITASTEKAASTGAIERAAYIVFNTTTAGTEYINYQFKIMVAATEQEGYEPHQCASYAVSEDGTAEVQSISPNMTVFCNVADVNGITVNYWKSCAYDNGYEEGSTFYHDFWDAYQNNGARTDYSNFGFGNSHWNDATFKPKYNMRITSAVNMFNASSIVDANGCLNKAGVTMDFSKCKDFYQMFCFSKIEVAPIPIDVSSATRVTSMFQYASALKTLKLTGLGEGRTPSLEGCTALINLELEGSIYGTFHMYKTPNLTVESAKNVLLALNDYSGTDNAFAYSLSLHSKVWAALDALGATSPNGNTWRQYADDKSWNT